MFALIESAPTPRRGDWAPGMASFAAHAALIAAAVALTRSVVEAPPPVFVSRDLVWQTPSPSPDLPVSSSSSSWTTPAPTWTVLPTPPVNISPDIPPPGTSEVLPGPVGVPLPGPVIGNQPGGLPLANRLPLDARVVDEQPVMVAHPVVNYPEVLRQAGIEGRVLVEAVLDTMGRAEPASLRVAESPNPLFDRDALAVVAASRYRPGRVDGRAVRVRIQVPVAFSLRR